MRKWMMLAAGLAAVAGLGVLAYNKVMTPQQGKKQGQGGPVAVEVVSVAQGDIPDVASFSGTLNAKTQFTVAPKIAGRLVRLLVDIGDTIKSGQVIAELDDDEYRQEVEQSKAELLVAKANLEDVQSSLDASDKDLERIRQLRDKKVVSESELDDALTTQKARLAKHKVAAAQVSQREAALRTAEVHLSYTKICATWDAATPRVIGERFMQTGDMLQANTAVVSVLDISTLTAIVNVIELDYPKVRLGQKATISTDAYPARTFSGEVSRIAPMLKESSRQGRIEIVVANPDLLLRPGMFIRAQLEFQRHANATVVPVTAVLKRDAQAGVFLLDERTLTVQFVPITQGLSQGGNIEVVSPALSGRVVTLGQHLVKNGSKVLLSADSPHSRPSDKPKRAASQAGEGR